MTVRAVLAGYPEFQIRMHVWLRGKMSSLASLYIKTNTVLQHLNVTLGEVHTCLMKMNKRQVLQTAGMTLSEVQDQTVQVTLLTM